MHNILKKVELDFTSLEFHKDFVISRMREDAVVSKEQFQELLVHCNTFYHENAFFYISHRLNNSNVDPTIYLEISKAVNLNGIAVVTEKSGSMITAQFEKHFINLPYEVFPRLEDAVAWGHKIIEE